MKERNIREAMYDLKGKDYLTKKLEAHRPRVLERYRYYEMKKDDLSPGMVIPAEIRNLFKSTLGWCGKAVDSMADRLVFREFSDDIFGFNEIFNMNNPDTFFDSAILSALISSCCFIYISTGEEDFPRLQVIEGSNATGVIDPITGLLREGYAVLKRDEYGRPETEAYFVPNKTLIYENGKLVEQYAHAVPYPLLVPIIHRPDAVRPFGRSRITRAGIYFQKYAQRTLERADISAEFYSFPQKYVVGTSQDAEPMDKWKATISTLLEFTKDEEGDSPKLGQFTQQSMSPFTEQLRTAAAGFAGETGLTLDDLGFVTDNPSSAEAIKSSHEQIRISSKKAQRCFGSGFLNVGYLAACLRDNYPYLRSQIYNVTPKWEPVFEADASTLSLIGDGAIKINQAIPEYITGETIRDLTGVEGNNQ
jgi:hypothetical protein